MQKLIEGDRVAGVSLHLYRVPSLYSSFVVIRHRTRNFKGHSRSSVMVLLGKSHMISIIAFQGISSIPVLRRYRDVTVHGLVYDS